MKSHSHAGGAYGQPAGSSRSNFKTKHRLANAINESMLQQGLSQSEAAVRLGIPQPKVSALVNYHLDGFSVQRLFRILNDLGRDVVIQIGNPKRPGVPGKTSVNAA
jgi:predicted XRE-type DNA-binding protein